MQYTTIFLAILAGQIVQGAPMVTVTNLVTLTTTITHPALPTISQPPYPIRNSSGLAHSTGFAPLSGFAPSGGSSGLAQSSEFAQISGFAHSSSQIMSVLTQILPPLSQTSTTPQGLPSVTRVPVFPSATTSSRTSFSLPSITVVTIRPTTSPMASSSITPRSNTTARISGLASSILPPADSYSLLSAVSSAETTSISPASTSSSSTIDTPSTSAAAVLSASVSESSALPVTLPFATLYPSLVKRFEYPLPGSSSSSFAHRTHTPANTQLAEHRYTTGYVYPLPSAISSVTRNNTSFHSTSAAQKTTAASEACVYPLPGQKC